MRKFLTRHSVAFYILLILSVWRLYFLVIESLRHISPIRYGYLGFIPQANFDGVYYLAISQYSYRGLDQAFFPFYPLVIQLITRIFSINPAAAALIVSISCTYFLMYTFYKLMALDNYKKYAFWTIIFLVSFPTSFFFVSVYTESLFCLLVLLSFYFARKKRRILAGVFGGIASGTRVIGIFLLPALFLEYYLEFRKEKKKNLKKVIIYFSSLLIIPLGLMGYMGFLWRNYADPLLFVHQQSSFGAGRSDGEIILLPQVVFRYVKIVLTVPSNTMTFWIALLEMGMLLFGIAILYLALRKGIRKSYILFSICALMFPTLSGTLSSLPRYALVSFAVFMYLGTIKNVSLKVGLIAASLVLQGILALLFFQGYFVS